MNENNPNQNTNSQIPDNENQQNFNQNPYSQYGDTPENKMDKSLKIFIITIISIFVVLVALLGIAVFVALPQNINKIVNYSNNISSKLPSIDDNNTTPKSEFHDPNGPTLTIEDIPQGQDEQTAEQIFLNVSPSIVFISANNNSEISGSQGSGVVISENGYIITNAHVLDQNVKVTTTDGTIYSAKIVGLDNRTDLAVIKIDTVGLKPAVFGNSDQLSVGSAVLSIGNPGGIDFSNSLTKGIVSAINRTVLPSNTITKYIQTDAAINPGSSGGALLNMYGQVIGINSSKIVSTSYEGMCFAIPSTSVKPIVEDLIKQGYVSNRVKLGIMGKEVTETQSKSKSIPQGIIISSISDQSDFANKDIQANDIITKINGVEITTFGTLYSELQKYNAGDTVTLTIFRPENSTLSNGKTFDVDITLMADE